MFFPLSQAFALLKPGGYIAVSDFTVTRSHSFFTRTFWPALLGLDGVRPNVEHIEHLDKKFTRVHLLVEKGGFPYVPEIFAAVGALLGFALAWAVAAYPSFAASLCGLYPTYTADLCASTFPIAFGALALGALAAVNTFAVAFFGFCVISYLFLDGEELLGPSALSLALLAAFNGLWQKGIAWSAGNPREAEWRWTQAITKLYALPGVYAYSFAVADSKASVLGSWEVGKTTDVPAWVYFAAWGAALAYALSAFFKAPYYSYVAQKRK
jgi:hypothetical protein